MIVAARQGTHWDCQRACDLISRTPGSLGLVSMYKLCLILCISCLMACPLKAAEIPPIKELMSNEDIQATGVEKLSESELEALREWIDVFSERDAKFVRKQYLKKQKEAKKALARANRIEQKESEQARVARIEQKAKEPEAKAQTVVRVETVNRRDESETKSRQEEASEFHSRIQGEFNGWTGRTRFRLENGQVWQPRKRDSQYVIRAVQNPRVIIRKNFLGFYVMELPDLKKKIPVKRLE